MVFASALLPRGLPHSSPPSLTCPAQSAMDIDESTEVEMAVTPAPDHVPMAYMTGSYSDLAALFDPFPFTADVISNIIARRAFLGGELVIDQLLEQASITSSSYLFPPASLDDLKALLTAIEESPWDAQKKTGLCFYLLAYVDPEVAQTATALPPHFSALAHACFLLDCGDGPSLQRAVALLADARIVQDLAPKILQTLDLAGEPHLVRTYVRTAHPVLQTFEDAEIYLRALLSLNLSEAWTFQREFVQGSNMRNQLVRVILDACFMPPHTVHLPHLLSLPLSAYELALLQAYALSPPAELTPAAHAILQDLLIVRMLSAGKYSDAIRVSRAFAEKDTEARRTGKTAAKALTRAADERSTTMRTVLNVLPAVQRRELEKEFDGLSENTTAKPNGIVQTRRSGENGDLSLSGSWEDLAYSSMSASMGGTGRLEGSPAPRGSGFFTSSSRGKNPLNPPFTTASPVTKGVLPVRTPAKGTPPIRPPMLPISKCAPVPLTKPASNTSSVTPSLRHTPRGSPIPTIFASTTQKPAPISNGTLNKIQSPPVINAFCPGARFGIQATPTPTPLGPNSSSTGHLSSSPPGTGLFSNLRSSATAPLYGASSTAKHNNASLFRTEKSTESAEEDITMVDSDDPDAFVVHGRRRQLFRPVTPPQEQEQEYRGKDQNQDQEDTSSPPHPTVQMFPGGFEPFELREKRPPSPSRSFVRKRPIATSPKETTAPQKSSRIQIPGAFHDEPGEEEAEEHETEAEEDDDVPSLPPIPSPPRTRRSRSRLSTASAESGDDGNEPKLRRSSRLSAASPQKKPSSKKSGARTTAGPQTKKRKA